MEKQSVCAIFAGGPEAGLPCEPVPEHAYILCADSGLRLAERLGLTPDLVIGDFDSLGAEPTQYPHITVPVEKDDPDTMLAARLAVERGFRDVRIYGPFGGRLDHTLANLETLEFLRGAGAKAKLIGAGNQAELLTGGEECCLPRREGWSLSLLSWSERCSGVTARGVYYPLEKGELRRDFPLGLSNHITAPEAVVTLEHGLLLILQSKL